MVKVQLFLMIFLFSCSYLQSGIYLQVKNDKHLEKISKEYGINISYLKEINQNSVEKGSWIFVPTTKGIINIQNDNVNPAFIRRNHFLWPVPAVKKISSKYGKRWGKRHEGIDIPAPEGTHFLSSANGVVIYSGRGLPSYGNMVVIDHGKGFHSVYAHAKTLFVRKGQTVSKGEVIGQVGSTGRSTGPHLHFEIREEKKPVNPEHYLVFN